GVTPPIATTPPTEREIQVTTDLVESLKRFGQYESEEEAQKREEVLGKLNDIFKEFVKKVSLKNNLPESMAAEAGGMIFTFGSYRLGVHGKSSDIDTLCVAPKHVKREDFFEEMQEALKARPEVTEMAGVPDSYVPVLKFHFSDIPIDLVFARLALPSVPDTLNLADDNLLKNLDERCIRSLNGSRVTDEILRLVPNIDAFRIALRCIKLWAKRRAIYSNVMGFFGGVAWAILIARVCQLYPNAAAGAIVGKFFRIMHQWTWPQPVLLKPIEEGPLAVRVWNPKIYPQDKLHKMPVITPAYPSMCATHNVTSSTQAVTHQEFERAANITDRVVLGLADWNELFTKNDFFQRYKYYLQVIASSDSAETQLKWSGMVESRLRQLIMKLETVENLEIAHPYIEGFDKVTLCANEQEKQDAAQGVNIIREPGAPELDPATALAVHTTTFYIGLQIKAKEPGSAAGRKLVISWPLSDFIGLVKSWDHYVKESMGIVVQYVKRYVASL
ncbi:Poly(A) polymerase central domain-containing protein, partial [Blyttiomyces helicus]